MTDITTSLHTSLIQGNTLSDAMTEIMRSELESAVTELMRNELTAYLDYEKWDPVGYHSGDSRNGTYTRQLDTKFGKITVEVPRDRNGSFQQHTLPAYKHHDDALETTVIQLYQKGVTTTEIADLIQKMYGSYYTPASISNITKQVEEQVRAFHNRKLAKRYSVVYGDATYLNVRRDTVAKEALHILIGIDEDGKKEVLDYRLYPSESCENYREMIHDLKNRGIEQILLFVTDGLKELRNICLEEFPKSRHQACWVHLMRAMCRHIRRSDWQKVLDAVKPIYRAENEAEAQSARNQFLKACEKGYPKAANVLKNSDSLFSFYSFPKEIWHSIYTTNPIESFNKQLKRSARKKEQFPNEDSLDRFVGIQVLDYNCSSQNRTIRGFKEANYKIQELFDSTRA